MEYHRVLWSTIKLENVKGGSIILRLESVNVNTS